MALSSVGLQRQQVSDITALLSEFGFQTALDLQLLGNGPEGQETMIHLQARGISIADRAKMRLLLGDHAHLHQLTAAVSPSQTTDVGGRLRHTLRRGAQEESASTGMTADTVLHFSSQPLLFV